MKLMALRKIYIQTMFDIPASGYVYGCDGFYATFLPGRNVVIVEAESLDGLQAIKKICQVADYHKAVDLFPGRNEPGMMNVFGRGIEGFDAAGQIPGVVIEAIYNR